MQIKSKTGQTPGTTRFEIYQPFIEIPCAHPLSGCSRANDPGGCGFRHSMPWGERVFMIDGQSVTKAVFLRRLKAHERSRESKTCKSKAKSA